MAVSDVAAVNDGQHHRWLDMTLDIASRLSGGASLKLAEGRLLSATAESQFDNYALRKLGSEWSKGIISAQEKYGKVSLALAALGLTASSAHH